MPFHVCAAAAQPPLAEPTFHCWTVPPGDEIWCEFRHVGADVHLRFPGLADFVVAAGGSEVQATPVPELDAATLDHLYRNQVLPLALSAQGIPVFHASGVELDGEAVAFVGESGRGKSTLATYLALHGARLITDDGLELDGSGGVFRAQPGRPSIRLWEDSQAALVGDRLPAAPAVSFTSKARFLADQTLPVSEQVCPLRRVYFLGEGKGDAVSIAPMGAAEAALEWIKHSFLLDIGDKQRLASHFDQVGGLAAQGISYRLDYPRDYARLGEVRAAVLDDLAA